MTFRVFGILLALCLLTAAAFGQDPNAEQPLKIVNALYGRGIKTVNVTEQLRAMIQEGGLTVTAADALAGDPAPGEKKRLRIAYQYKGKSKIATVEEGEEVTLPPADSIGKGGLKPLALGVEIKGPILSEALVMAVRAGRLEAKRRRASVIVFEIDTPGGRLDIAEKIFAEMQEIDGIPSVAWLRGQGALSAGVWISLGCRYIVMSPGTVIGASTPYVLEQDQTKAIHEKHLSALRARYRAAAEIRDRPSAMAEAMIDPSLEVWAVHRDGDTVYIKKAIATDADAENKVGIMSEAGRLLTLSPEKAVEVGFADALADEKTLPGVLQRLTGLAEKTDIVLDYRHSETAPFVLKQELDKEGRVQEKAEDDIKSFQKKLQSQWDEVNKGFANINALLPGNFSYSIDPKTRRFTDGGKTWRRRIDKCVKEISRTVDKLNDIIAMVEKQDNPANANILAEMKSSREKLRTQRRLFKEYRAMKGVP